MFALKHFQKVSLKPLMRFYTSKFDSAPGLFDFGSAGPSGDDGELLKFQDYLKDM